MVRELIIERVGPERLASWKRGAWDVCFIFGVATVCLGVEGLKLIPWAACCVCAVGAGAVGLGLDWLVER